MNKYIIPLVILMLAVFGWKYSEPTEKQGAQSPTINPQTQNNVPQKSSTGFSSGTFYTGGTQSWSGGVTPSDSFQTVQHFTPPNTNWSTRTLSGITYVFGEGNPKEVALTAEQIKEVGKRCESHDMNDVLYKEGFCNPETERLKYLSADAEKHIMVALSDSNWEKLQMECSGAFRTVETPDTFQNAKDNSNFPYFDRVFAPGFLDIDNFISIDPMTGWKKLNTERSIGLVNFLMQATLQGQTEILNPYGDCVDRYAKEIVRNFEIATVLYVAPLDFSN